MLKKVVPSGNYGDNEAREKVGVFAGIVGIIVNFVLFAAKFTVGSLFGFVSITADAFNNLSDCGSSVISIVSSRMSSKSPDKEHPFGHQRIEYIASLGISFIILFLGVSLFYSSVLRVMNPEKSVGGIVVIAVLTLSSLMKLWLYFFNKKAAALISSTVIKAVSLDSLSDAAATFGVLISVLLSPVIGFDLDGIAGMLVAALILKEGIGIIRETFNHIIGSPPDKDLIEGLTSYITGNEEVLNTHDLIVHSYGPNRIFASVHAEMPGTMSLRDAHEIADRIERAVSEKFGVSLTVHMDPSSAETSSQNYYFDICRNEVVAVYESLSIHGFRYEEAKNEDEANRIYFDVTKPYSSPLSTDEIYKTLFERISNRFPEFAIYIAVDEVFT